MKIKNPISKFMFTLFFTSIITIILWIIIIQIYQTNKITAQINQIIKSETTLISHKITTFDIHQLKNIIKNNKMIIALEIYNDKKEKIFDLKKEKYNFLMKNILKYFNNFSNATKYKLIPIHSNKIYIYFQTSTKINNKHYFINLLLKLNNETIIVINKEIRRSILIILSTILIIYIAVFPIIYSQYKNLLIDQEKIYQGNINTLIALGNAIAQKDSETSHHNYRVTYYSIKLAEQINMKFEQIQSLIKGAFLHDIGKIGIPDSILLKTTKLTKEEFEIMKTHVLKGKEIVDKNPLLEDAKDVILYHHERYDGSGYMQGLKKEEIPFNARLFAVIDVFDALTSKRPYKEPFSAKKSIEIIKKGSGTHFDPKIVKEFIKIYQLLYDEIYTLKLSDLEDNFYQIIKPYFDIEK